MARSGTRFQGEPKGADGLETAELYSSIWNGGNSALVGVASGLQGQGLRCFKVKSVDYISFFKRIDRSNPKGKVLQLVVDTYGLNADFLFL